MTYEEAKEVYGELTRNKTGRMTAHRTVERWAGKIQDLGNPPLPEVAGKEHVTGDGVMVPLREEGWKEAKVGGYYKVDEERKAQTIRYTATLGSREEFGQRLYELAQRPSLEKTAQMAYVSDAAEWLDGIQQMQFPLAERIVDVFHAEEYLWDVANAFYQKGTVQARQWAEGKVQQLREADQKGLQKSLAHMKPKGRYNIKVAQKNGVQVRKTHKKKDLNAFYEILQKTSVRDGFGVHKKAYYQKWLESGEKNDWGTLFVAEQGGKIIGGLLLAWYGETAIYYYGASDHAYRNLMAPYLLQWEAICNAKKRGMKIYDFLGIAPPEAKETHPWKGITEFKEKFGGQKIRYPEAKEYVFKPILYRILCAAKRLKRCI
jgi:hypothetical protein